MDAVPRSDDQGRRDHDDAARHRHHARPRDPGRARIRTVHRRRRAITAEVADARAVPARPRVVVTGPWLLPGWDDGLIAAGCEVICGPSTDEAPSRPLSEDELRRLCSGA